MARTKRQQYDWEAIEREYCLGQKSNRTLSSEFGPSHTSIGRRAKKYGWVKDKTQEVQQKTRAALLTTHQDQRTTERTSKRTTPTREDIDRAVQTNVEVIRQHRKTVARTIAVAERLLDEIEKAKDVDLRAHGDAFRTISTGLAKVIPLERQAFNLDASAGDDDAPEAIIIKVRKNANAPKGV